MRYYTVKEFAKKMKVSEGHIYELVKNGEIKKAPGTGRVIRIPSNQINTLKDRNVNNFFTYNRNKVEIIKTSLGEIRKLKNSNQFVLTDISTAIGINQSQTIRDAVKDECIKKLELSEAQELGLRCSYAGLLIVSLEGLEEYSLKTFEPLKINTLLKELKSNLDYVQTEFKAVENSNSLPKMFEGHQVEIIEVDGDILFELYSTGMALGQTKESKGILYPRKDRIEQNLKSADIEPVVRNGQPYLTEPMLYDFMLEAKTDKCKIFRKWVTNEVLPTIRKTGGYVDNSEKFVDNYFSNLSDDVKKTIKTELKNKNRELVLVQKRIDQQLEANLKVIDLIDGIERIKEV